MKNKLAEVGRRLVALFHRGRFDADLEEEMRLHQELRKRQQVECGVSREEAHYAAQRRFGNKLVLREESRDMWGWNWLETFLQDVRYGLRQLRRNPGFTTVAVLTLALGIGANTAIFSMVNAVLLQPLPYKASQRLVRLEEMEPGSASPSPVVSGRDFVDYQKENHVFEEMAAGFLANKALAGSSEPMQISGFEVSPQTFQLLGISPLIGGTFTQDETERGQSPDFEFICDRDLTGRQAGKQADKDRSGECERLIAWPWDADNRRLQPCERHEFVECDFHVFLRDVLSVRGFRTLP
jgi:MacB-like periplasmic core domain